jgi:hypothetical protein
MRSKHLVVSVLLFLPACTTGKIVDVSTGDGIAGAKVEVWRAPNGSPDKGWPDPSPTPDFTTTAASGTGGVFWFDPKTETTSTVQGNSSSTSIAPGWTRVRITAEGRVQSIFWQFREFNSLCRDWSSPDPQAKVLCDNESYPMIPTMTGNDLLPDMVADVGRLTDYEFSCDGATRTLLVTAGSANIGLGDLVIQAQQTDAYQTISLTGGGTRQVKVTGQIVYHPQHGHLHYDNWMRYRIIRADDACQKPPEQRDNTHCVILEGDKTSTCLEDYAYFDAEVTKIAGVNPPQYTGCATPKMGVSAGVVDVYDKTIPGQALDVTAIPNGDYMLELHVDPDHQIFERSRDNNIARVPLHLPGVCD